MAEERQENLEEIKKKIKQNLKKEKELSEEELKKIMDEANENVDFLNTLKQFEVPTTGKKVIFVDGKACLVYDSGVFYIEDSVDSKKGKKKLSKQEATEVYVEYFFRYIMNPAIEKKKMMQDVRSITPKVKKEKNIVENIKEDKLKETKEIKKKTKDEMGR